ncbi:type I-E CRISPR-associated endonuclease Cas1e [Brevibacterium sp. BRM-1]|uniref:type I-E CRISPR-associated endonuclease Cas1e n=1 Tax=Brevibacterium sp. BRM-1 TaxID=2999062 RepID=UPI0022811E13|nr:type I-E CRISPR-associated endonuclease Cas1e [Brevibacterium sp. BRM-1]WAL39142.1 type I-E CRISPR-associated endonuclease Cas1e [Brevibacterium sp. BRM-1]
MHRDANALTITDERGTVHVPTAALSSLLLGPGTRTTHAAMSVLGDSGVTVVWVGERGVRFYACGRPLAKSSRMAEVQAAVVSNQRRRLQSARKMYALRFPGEDVSGLTMHQLRGREGVRMKRIYTAEAQRTGVQWSRRQYSPDDFEAGDDINRALTAASAALYGVAHAAIVSLGCIPSLGVVHSGTDRSFVYDVADLFKAEVSIPAAFDAVQAASDSGDDPAVAVRRLVRDRMVGIRLMPRLVEAIFSVLNEPVSDELVDADLVLWSEFERVTAGMNWASEDVR